jgi:hypothetical protein
MFEELFARLQSVRYIYEREMSIAVQQSRAPNLIALHEELESGWHALCVRAGLIQQNGQAPPLSMDRLLEAPSQNLNELLVNLGAPSIHSTFQPWPHIQPEPLSTSASSLQGTIPPRASSITLSDPLMPSHTATMSVASCYRLSFADLTSMLPHKQSKRIMRLRHWKCHGSGDARKIVWVGENSVDGLEHHRMS